MKQRPEFEDTQLHDRSAKPALERPASFFFPEDYVSVEERRLQRARARKRRGFGVLFLVAALLFGTGVVLVLEASHVLRAGASVRP